jgi:anthranilate synthase/aminodeoxychorismate synthase-like glutamine amidotransferase
MATAQSVLILDHFDSFTYNLFQCLAAAGSEVEIIRTNVSFDEIKQRNPTRLILSPGPGHPAAVGVFHQAIDHWAGQIPILGVCLGHQALGLSIGAKVVRADRQMHGKTSLVHHTGEGLFRGLSNPFQAMRYHSLVVEDIPLEKGRRLAWTDQAEVMGLEVLMEPSIVGVQFHPESYYTPEGEQLLRNFLE